MVVIIVVGSVGSYGHSDSGTNTNISIVELEVTERHGTSTVREGRSLGRSRDLGGRGRKRRGVYERKCVD